MTKGRDVALELDRNLNSQSPRSQFAICSFRIKQGEPGVPYATSRHHMTDMQCHEKKQTAAAALRQALILLDELSCSLAAGYVQLAIDRIESCVVPNATYSSPSARKLQ